MNQLSQILKQRRQEMKLSLRAAANLIGISHAYLDKLEKGFDARTGSKNKPTPETLKLISQTYEIEYMDLLAFCGYINPQNKDCDRINNSDIKKLLRIASNLPPQKIHNLILYAKCLTPVDHIND